MKETSPKAEESVPAAEGAFAPSSARIESHAPVSQAFDPVQIRPGCPEVIPPHPSLQSSLSNSTEQVPAKPLSHNMALCCGSAGQTASQTVPVRSSSRDSPAQRRGLGILEECEEMWIEKHWTRMSPWSPVMVGAQEIHPPPH